MHRLLYAVVYCNTRAGNWQFSYLSNLACVSSNAILLYSFIRRHDTSFICNSSSSDSISHIARTPFCSLFSIPLTPLTICFFYLFVLCIYFNKLSIYLSISSMYWWTSWSGGDDISAQIIFKKRFVCENLYRLRLTEYTNAKSLPSIERNQPKMYFCEFDVLLIIINPNEV